jgi:hypothetical protein
LDAAKVAVIEFPEEQPFQHDEDTPVHGVDQIALLEFLNAHSTAERASGVRAEMEPISAGRVFFTSAFPALIRGRVAKLLKQRSMYALKRFPAIGASFHLVWL